MHIRTISVELGGTIPTVQYGNITVKIRYDADLEGDDSPEDVVQDLTTQIQSQLVKTLRPLVVKKRDELLEGVTEQNDLSLVRQRFERIPLVQWYTDVSRMGGYRQLDIDELFAPNQGLE